MLVDNVRAAHSREPFRGEREVLVELGRPGAPGGGRPMTAAERIAVPRSR